jgi:tripeptidyl-peptidase-1
VQHYLSTVSRKPQPGYSTGGRGYPDIALSGKSYAVIIGGKTYSVSGTSASAPVFAGMVSLVND